MVSRSWLSQSWLRHRWLRRLPIAAPFALIAVGAWCLVRSPWPSIWRLMLQGRHVLVAYTWTTVGLPTATVVCFAAAIVLSLQIRR